MNAPFRDGSSAVERLVVLEDENARLRQQVNALTRGAQPTSMAPATAEREAAPPTSNTNLDEAIRAVVVLVVGIGLLNLTVYAVLLIAKALGWLEH